MGEPRSKNTASTDNHEDLDSPEGAPRGPRTGHARTSQTKPGSTRRDACQHQRERKTGTRNRSAPTARTKAPTKEGRRQGESTLKPMEERRREDPAPNGIKLRVPLAPSQPTKLLAKTANANVRDVRLVPPAVVDCRAGRRTGGRISTQRCRGWSTAVQVNAPELLHRNLEQRSARQQ